MKSFAVTVRIDTMMYLFWTVALCHSYSLHPGVWHYQNHPIAYERAVPGVEETSSSTQPTSETSFPDSDNNVYTPILLLNGFGVGSFHQHRLIDALMNQHNQRTIYGIDYLGQGASWPEDCNDGESESEKGLRYCGRTWISQITQFIEQVVLAESSGINKRVHIVGNSVGGHLAVFIAAQRPDLVETLCLLNATPVWGFGLPGWTGHLPAPPIPKRIGRCLFDKMRDYSMIEKYLENAYANRAAFDQTLVEQIRGSTEGKGGPAAFTSMLWSPPISISLEQSNREATFFDCLAHIICDVLLILGKDDPWCGQPALAKRMLHQLNQRPSGTAVHRYVELDSVGHCPNHEAPIAVACILQEWLNAPERDRQHLTLVPGGEALVVQEEWGATKVQERQECEIKPSIMDRLATAFVVGNN